MNDNKTKERGGFIYLLKIAYRNIFRNKRRSILCITAVGFAVLIIISFISFIDGMMDSIKKVVFTFEVGHIQIYHQDYEKKKEYMPLQYTVTSDNGSLNDYLNRVRDIPNVKAVLPRIITGATLTNSNMKHAVLWGIDLEQERQFNQFNLTTKSDGLLTGRFPEAGKNECAIGIRFARTIEFIPKQIEFYEFDWLKKNLDNSQASLLNQYYRINSRNSGYTILNNLDLQGELALLSLFMNIKINELPAQIEPDSNVIYDIFQNALYQNVFLSGYEEQVEPHLYRLKNDLADDQKELLLMIFQKTVELKIPFKVVSSKFSDKYIAPKVTGIYNFDYAIVDKHYIIMPFDRVQSLVNLKNETQSITVFLKNLNNLEETKKAVRNITANSDYLVKDWTQYSFIAIMRQMEWIYYLMYAVFIVLASFLIINTVIMVIHERIKEIGMMGALGLRRVEIVLIFFFEAVVLSFIGSVFGTVAGGVLTGILSNYPISMEAMTGGLEFQYSNTIFVGFSVGILSFGFGFGLLLSSLCTILPSLKAAFIQPVEALRR